MRSAGRTECPGRSIVWPVALLLALATVGLLVRTATVLTSPVAVAPASANRATESLVREFYVAVETARQSGDTAHLSAIVTSDFVNHPPENEIARAGEARSLTQLVRDAPSMGLVIERFIIGENRVAVRVTGQRALEESFLNLSVHRQATTRTRVDLFRTEGGLIAEYWSGAVEDIEPRTVLQATISPSLVAPAAISLTRWTYLRQISLPWIVAPGPMLLSVEVGTLTAAFAETNVVLSAGEMLTIPAETPYALRNDGSVAAVVLQFAVFPIKETLPDDEHVAVSAAITGVAWLSPAGATQETVVWPPGVTVQEMGGGVANQFPAGPLAVIGGQITLEENDLIAAHTVTGVELIVVERGLLSVTAEHELQRTRLGGVIDLEHPGVVSRTSFDVVNNATLVASETVLLSTGAVQNLRNAETIPLDLFIVTIRTADTEVTIESTS